MVNVVIDPAGLLCYNLSSYKKRKLVELSAFIKQAPQSRSLTQCDSSDVDGTVAGKISRSVLAHSHADNAQAQSAVRPSRSVFSLAPSVGLEDQVCNKTEWTP